MEKHRVRLIEVRKPTHGEVVECRLVCPVCETICEWRANESTVALDVTCYRDRHGLEPVKLRSVERERDWVE
jgi:hypothetical protein